MSTEKFLLDAVDLDDVSVSREDGERVIAIVQGHGEAVDGSKVVDLARKYDLQVSDVGADLDSGTVAIEVGAGE